MSSQVSGSPSHSASIELLYRQDLLRAENRRLEQRLSNRNRLFAGAGVAVAAAAAVLLIFVFAITEDSVETVETPEQVADAEDEAPAHEVAVTREQVDGASRLRLASGSRVHADGGAELELAKADASTTRFALNSGRAVFEVEKLSAEQQFIVDVPGGQIRVLGTVFCVDIRDGRLDLRVAEGVVFYRADHGRGETIRAGQALGIDGAIRELAQAEVAEIEQIFGDEVERLAVEVAVEQPREAEPRPSRDAIDEPEPGSEPEEAIEAVEVQIDPVQQEPEPEAVPTIAELMSRAAELRAGSRWAELIEVYGDVARIYPSSAEAQTCFVLMGNVQLKQVRNYAAALKSYQSYLARSPNGSLAEEADWGVAVAFRKLGRRDDERAALERFARRHPGSPFAPVVEERLAELAP